MPHYSALMGQKQLLVGDYLESLHKRSPKKVNIRRIVRRINEQYTARRFPIENWDNELSHDRCLARRIGNTDR